MHHQSQKKKEVKVWCVKWELKGSKEAWHIHFLFKNRNTTGIFGFQHGAPTEHLRCMLSENQEISFGVIVIS